MSQNMTSRASPPLPPAAFRVGVVGHRPNRLDKADTGQLAETLRDVLATIRGEVEAVCDSEAQLFSPDRPLLWAISPLAEGTDRLFAEQALESGYELACVMPFTKSTYQEDFAPNVALEENSLERFDHLVGQAHIKFELDGSPSDIGLAYGTAGRTVLNQSDVLVVVWDGQRQDNKGGTEETLDDARSRGVLVVLIDACAPHSWQVLDGAAAMPAPDESGRCAPELTTDHEDLRKHVRAALELPRKSPLSDKSEHPHSTVEDAAAGLREYYAEHQPRWSSAILWKLFRDIVGDGKIVRPNFKKEPIDSLPEAEPKEKSPSPFAKLFHQLRPYYAWPDHLAVIYSDRYRSAFIAAFILAAFAVGMALLPLGLQMASHSAPETYSILAEFVAILMILLLVLTGRWLRWHERWIDYRLTAELVRHLRVVLPLGGKRPFPQIPAHWAVHGQVGSTWMAWYVRGIERYVCLPDVIVDKEYLLKYLGLLDELIEDQANFHKITLERSDRIELRLHRMGIALLFLTLFLCFLHLLPGFWGAIHYPAFVPPLLTFCCGFFPALGAAMAGILNQGEFRRVAKRSESMFQQLSALKDETEALRTDISSSQHSGQEQFSVRASGLAEDIAKLLLNEVRDWRVVFLDRPLVPPS